MNTTADAYAGMNLYQKLAMLRKRVEVIQKTNPGFNYMYVSDTDLLAKLTGGMDEAGVSLIPSIVPGTLKVDEHNYMKIKRVKQDVVQEPVSEMTVSAEMTFTWVNNDNPSETITVPWVLVGQQGDASQAFGSALTYSYRYFLLKYFGVATPKDDPDYWRSEQMKANQQGAQAMTSQIVQDIDRFIRDKLSENSGFKDQLLDITKKYAPDANYMAIRNPDVAARLLADLQSAEYSVS